MATTTIETGRRVALASIHVPEAETAARQQQRAERQPVEPEPDDRVDDERDRVVRKGEPAIRILAKRSRSKTATSTARRRASGACSSGRSTSGTRYLVFVRAASDSDALALSLAGRVAGEARSVVLSGWCARSEARGAE